MKRATLYSILLTVFCAVCCSTQVAQATTYTDITITKTRNALTEHSAALGALLPAEFTSSVFDDAGNPIMDRIFLFMTMPAGTQDLQIQDLVQRIILTLKDPSNISAGFDQDVAYNSFTLTAGEDVVFSFVSDGTKYVLDRLPFDPTTRAMDELTVSANSTEKVYMAGSISGKLSAELPERIKILMPSYLESLRQSLNDLLIAYVKDYVSSAIPNFSLNPNCEGFFQFTGDVASHLHLYQDNLALSVEDKETDFLGSILADMITLNLLGLEGSDADPMTDAEVNALTDEQIAALSRDQIRALTTAQAKTIAPKLTDTQCNYLTIGQVLGMLGYTDILQALANTSATGMSLFTIFQDQDKAQAAGNVLNSVNNQIMSQLSPYMSNPMGLITGGGSVDLSALMTMLGQIFSSFVSGSGSPFAFKSNSQSIEEQAFNIHIHSKGENTITGGAAGNFKNVGVEMNVLLQLMDMTSGAIADMVNDLAVMFAAMVHFCSAPYAVRPSAKMVDKDVYTEYSYTVARMLFDDIWTDGTTRTNGLLQMPVVGDELDAPSIDLGTPNGQAIFNGGRYKFHTPVSNKKKNMFYVATMAICYREFTVTMPLVDQRITYTGIGTSVGWGPSGNRADTYRNVIIYDGTFTTYSAEAWKDPARGENAVDAVANGWYQHYTDLRLPYNTAIVGGTFPEDTYVYRCDAAAEQGVMPVFVYIDPVDPYAEPYYTALCERAERIAYPDLTATDPAPKNSNGTLIVDNDKKLKLTVNTSPSTTQDIEYGTSSLTPDSEDKVYVYITGECTIERNYIRNYVTALAPFGEKHMSAEMLSMGGDVEVESLYQGKAGQKQQNSYLFYTQLGYYTFNYAGVNLGGLFRTLKQEFQIETAAHSQNIDQKSGVVFSEITNSDEYTIENGIYMMIPVMSDTWTMFCPPFDVANVYIMETTTEQPGKESEWSESDYEQFFRRQGTADGDMAQTLVTSVLPDIFSGRGSGVKKPLTYILDSLTNDDTKITRLTHYDGTFASLFTANYYLNVQLHDVENKPLWEMQTQEDLYGNKWAPAPQQSTPTFLTRTYEDPDCTNWYGCDDITVTEAYVDQDGNNQAQQWCIMKRDSVYAMYFPGGANRWYDHKYLIIEGYGPQKLSGKDKHSDFYSPSRRPDDGYIALQGNSTFGNATVSGSPIFYATQDQKAVWNTQQPHYAFTQYSGSSQRILPSSVYMVSSTNAVTKAAMPMLRNGIETTTDLQVANPNLPTLIDRSLDAWAENGIMLRAYEEQKVSIYSVDGHLVWSGVLTPMQTKHIPAPAGIYLIQGEETIVKLIVQ